MACVTVRVIPGSSKNEVKEDGVRLKVYLTRHAQQGQANEQLIGVLAAYYQVKKYQIRILKGARTRTKVVEIGC